MMQIIAKQISTKCRSSAKSSANRNPCRSGAAKAASFLAAGVVTAATTHTCYTTTCYTTETVAGLGLRKVRSSLEKKETNSQGDKEVNKEQGDTEVNKDQEDELDEEKEIVHNRLAQLDREISALEKNPQDTQYPLAKWRRQKLDEIREHWQGKDNSILSLFNIIIKRYATVWVSNSCLA
jgi:hypothetical protein